MRILYIITQADGGGAQNYVLDLARRFNGAIAAGSEAGDLFKAARSFGLETFPLKHLKRSVSPWDDFLAIWEIHQLIQIHQPEIVHLNSTKAGILGSFACRGLKPKPKIIFTAHGFVFNEPMVWAIKSLYIALEKTASDARDMIIAVSEADRKSALNYKIAPAEKIQIIHNGLAKIDFLPPQEAKKRLNLPLSKFLFVTVANFYKTKALDVLIEAASFMPKELLATCEFMLIGNGPELKNLKSKIKNFNLESTIKMLGKIDNAQRYLRGFNCFVLPSRKEGFPYVILEAMQANLPIIASQVGGIPEALGEAGVLVEAENPKRLAEALSRILTDKNLREELSQKTRSQSVKFGLEQMLEQTKKVYSKVLD